MDNWYFDPRLLWFLIGLAFLIGELFFLNIILLFFGVGAWIVLLTLCVIPLEQNSRLLLFLLASIVSLAILRSQLKNLLETSRLKPRNFTDLLQPDIIGQKVDVIEPINPPHSGRILLHGVPWTAVADRPFKAGDRVKIIRRDNLTLRVDEIAEKY